MNLNTASTSHLQATAAQNIGPIAWCQPDRFPVDPSRSAKPRLVRTRAYETAAGETLQKPDRQGSVPVVRLCQDFLFIVVMTVLGVLSKYWAGKYSSKIFGLKPLEGSIVGAGMVSRGEVALIVAQIGIAHHLFPKDIYSSLILVIILTTVLSPIMLNHYIRKDEAQN